MRLSMSRPHLAGMLFVVALPFNFIYSYLVSRGMFPAVPGLVGLLTYGLLVPLVARALPDTKIWRHGFLVASVLMLAYALVTAILYFFVFSVYTPEVDRELFGYHSTNVIRSLTFLLIGLHLTSYSRVGRDALFGVASMMLVVLANTDVHSLSMTMPDSEEQKGMYIFLGDTFAVVAIVALAYLRRNIVATLALCGSILVIYLIGSRSSLYAFLPAACLYAAFLVRGIRLPFNRLVFLVFITTISVISLSALFVFSDASQNRMLVFVATGQDSSWAFRAWQLAEGLLVIANNPFFGQYGSDYLLLNRVGDYIHSYLEIWRQFGILPFSLFLFAFTGAARALWAARARSEEPAWRVAALLMIFSGIEVAFSRTWGSPYIFAAIGMAASFAPIRRSARPAPVIQPPADAENFEGNESQAMMRIRNVHLILNDGQADSRLLREAGAIADLLAEGEGVEILGAAREPLAVAQLGPQVRLRQIALVPGRGRAARLKTALRLILWYLKVFRLVLPYGRIVFNVHHAELLPLALFTRLLTGSAIVYVPHELEAERAGQRASKSRIIAFIERFAWPRLAGAAVVNESIADEYLQRYGAPRPSVVENVQASAAFAGQPKDLHALTGLAPERRICIYVGALVPNRGIESLIEWFNATEQSEFSLVCMGRGDLAGTIEAAGANSDCIRLLPPVPPTEVSSYVAGADVSAVLIDGVSKNNNLSLPNKFFESIAGGTPVIVSPLVELRRFVGSYAVGTCIESRDAAAFFHACRNALSLPREDFEAGRRKLFAEHGWPVQCEKIQNIYRKAAEATVKYENI